VEVHRGVLPLHIPNPKYLTVAHQEWREHFTRFDSDRSGTIDSTELQNALTEFGYKVTPELLDILQRKYGQYLLMSLWLFALTRPRRECIPTTGR
jgi:Ca2+-binding EF-hand superfamily protein